MKINNLLSIVMFAVLLISACQKNESNGSTANQFEDEIKTNYKYLEEPTHITKDLVTAKLNMTFKNNDVQISDVANFFLIKEKNNWKIFCISKFGIDTECEYKYLLLTSSPFAQKIDYTSELKNSFRNIDNQVSDSVKASYPNLPEVNTNQLVKSQSNSLKIREVAPICEKQCKSSCSDFKSIIYSRIQLSDNNFNCSCYCNNIDKSIFKK